MKILLFLGGSLSLLFLFLLAKSFMISQAHRHLLQATSTLPKPSWMNAFHEDPLPVFLEDLVPQSTAVGIQQHKASFIALATFPANDFEPGSGNSLLLFSRGEDDRFYPSYERAYPMKVAARPYRGKHTGYRSVFLKSPIGIFKMHRGSANGSRYVSWGAETAKRMRHASFVPAFGLKVPMDLKPQKHFHYAIHTVPVGYTESLLRQRQFQSLGCFSLLVEDMRDVYKRMQAYAPRKRLFVSIYDTMSIDPAAQNVYVYRDIYQQGVNTLDHFYQELQKHRLDPKSFDAAKIRSMLDKQKTACQVVTFDSLR